MSGRSPWRMLVGLLLILLYLAPCGQASAADDMGFSTLVLFNQRIRGFDPVSAADVYSARAVGRVYETLLQYHYLDRPYRVVPLLAADMPEVSDDGLTYTFKIRDGIRFHDDPCFIATAGKGRELTAHDFVYAIKRLADRKNAATGYWIVRNRIVGLDAFRDASGGAEPTDYDMPVEGLYAPDDHTLVIRLVEPYPQLLWVLAMHYAAAVPHEAVAYYGNRFTKHPVGTGPYMLHDWRENYRIEYRRNPAWQSAGRDDHYPERGTEADREAGLLADAGHPVPFTDRIVDVMVTDPSTRWLMFLQDQLAMSDISRDNWDVVMDGEGKLKREWKERGIHLESGPTLQLGYLAFNMDDPVVGANPDLRRAMAHAFNTREWLTLQRDRVERATGPIPRGLAGYREGEPPYPYDLGLAKEWMVKAGYPNGIDPATGRRLQITLELGRADDSELRQSAELIVHMMSRIGIDLQLSYNNGPAFFDKLERRVAQTFMVSWLGDYPDAENFLQLFYSPNASPGPNRCNYRNPAFDDLFEVARTMQDSPERTEIYAKMADIVIADSPWIFLSQPLSFVLRRDRVRNYKMHAFPYGMEKFYRLVDPEEASRP